MATIDAILASSKSPKLAAKASQTVLVPHNVVTEPSVTVARKTPTMAGISLTQSAATKASKPTVPGSIPVAPNAVANVPWYDGSTSANPVLYPGNAPVDATIPPKRRAITIAINMKKVPSNA
jgi:hypothetical protein